MSKTTKNSIIIILIVIVALAIVWLIYDNIKQEPANANIVDTNTVDENAGLDNVINELFENVEVNEESEEITQKEPDKEVSTNKNASDKKEETKKETTSTEITTTTATSREEKAKELVKKEWGGSDGVYFACESIDSKGRYIVSVHKSKDTSKLAEFTVDIEKETVEINY